MDAIKNHIFSLKDLKIITELQDQELESLSELEELNAISNISFKEQINSQGFVRCLSNF